MDVLTALLLAFGVVVATWLGLVVVLWLHRPSRELAGPLLRMLPDLGRLVRAVLSDPATPRSVKVVFALLLLWLLTPIDLIPDFLPVVGVLDDVVLAAIVLRWAARRIGAERLRAHWTGTPEGWALVARLL